MLESLREIIATRGLLPLLGYATPSFSSPSATSSHFSCGLTGSSAERAIPSSVKRAIGLSRVAVPGRLRSVGGVPESPPTGSFRQEDVVRAFRPFGHTPPRCHSCHLSRGTSVPRETWRDQQTNYPPSTRLGLEWAPNQLGGRGLYWVVLGDLPVGVTNNAYTGLPQ